MLKHLNKNQVKISQVCLMLMIICHNFVLHYHIGFKVTEFEFHASYVSQIVQAISACFVDGAYWKLFIIFFKAVGFYPVFAFMILSAYGIAKRYEHESISLKPFMKRRFAYLYPPMIILIIAIVLNFPAATSAWDIFLNLSTLRIWVPGQQVAMIPSWWFLLMIVELYCVMPCLIRGFKKYGNGLLILLVAVQLIAELWINPLTLKIGLNLAFTPFGFLICVAIGFWWAGKPQFRFNWLSALLVLAAWAIAMQSQYSWPVSGPLMGLLMLWLISICKANKNRFIQHLIPLIVPAYLLHDLFVIQLQKASGQYSPMSFIQFTTVFIIYLLATYVGSWVLCFASRLIEKILCNVSGSDKTCELLITPP